MQVITLSLLYNWIPHIQWAGVWMTSRSLKPVPLIRVLSALLWFAAPSPHHFSSPVSLYPCGSQHTLLLPRSSPSYPKAGVAASYPEFGPSLSTFPRPLLIEPALAWTEPANHIELCQILMWLPNTDTCPWGSRLRTPSPHHLWSKTLRDINPWSYSST